MYDEMNAKKLPGKLKQPSRAQKEERVCMSACVCVFLSWCKSNNNSALCLAHVWRNLSLLRCRPPPAYLPSRARPLPPSSAASVEITNGKVLCCYDALKVCILRQHTLLSFATLKRVTPTHTAQHQLLSRQKANAKRSDTRIRFH